MFLVYWLVTYVYRGGSILEYGQKCYNAEILAFTAKVTSVDEVLSLG